MDKEETLSFTEWYKKYTGKPIPQSLKNIGELVERTEGMKLIMTKQGWRWFKIEKEEGKKG